MSFADVTVVIPCFNEENGIGSTLKALFERCPDIQVIVVDDGSSDGTSKAVRQFSNLRVIRHPYNRGYGAALKTGCRESRTPITAWYDADGQHRPDDLVRLIQTLREKSLDACVGRRDRKSAFVANRMPGKILLRLVSQIVARRKIPDLNCGLRVFRTTLLRRHLHLLPDGFSASTTTTLLFIKQGYRLDFELIQTAPRIGHSTVRWRDGFRTLALIARIIVTFDSVLFFAVLSLLQLIPGLAYSYIVAITEKTGVPVLGALVVLSGITTLCFGFLSSQINQIRREMVVFSGNEMDALEEKPESDRVSSEKA